MTAAAPLAPASLSMILAMIEQASGSRFNYRDGVIGLLAQPDRSARADVQHDGQPSGFARPSPPWQSGRR